ncbi:YycH family regulatory protein [Pontibacillus salipaludis]|uniref:YycH family regulatory protein n=1 Tax=Pontibacillus salipaludis TaxID=1697394 RepID=UPI0031F03C2F
MMWEYLKSIVLGLLVTISLLVTFALWTYQPEYDELNNGENILEVETKLSNGTQKSLTSIIKPELLLFHQNGRDFSLNEWSESEALYKKVLTWGLTDFVPVTGDSVIEKESGIEIVYPASIPLSTLSTTFTLNDDIEELLKSSYDVDRIFISIDPDEPKNAVYFISDDNANQYVKAMIPNVYNSVDEYLENPEIQREYFRVSEDRQVQFYLPESIYLPESKVTLPKEKLKGGNIEVDTMRNILFNNPQLVQQNSSTNGLFYNIDDRVLQIYPGEMRMRFQQYKFEESQSISREAIIKQSLDHINDHNGWTDESYSLFNINSRDNTIHYREYKNGYPVLDENELGLITQIWSNQDLIEYRRPLIRVKDNLSNQVIETETLSSGREVLSYIEDNKDQFSSVIKDIKIGYTMEVDSLFVIYMTPAWFVKEGEDWKKLDVEGATNNAVGTN